ncbi:hypothetical protein [Glycomyces sp. NPDC047010]|uniref:hypothetical protein n=1 Tax=Glycomyces sp. NPDC047010 TaxID=3155023 RepID=UPI0033D405D6
MAEDASRKTRTSNYNTGDSEAQSGGVAVSGTLIGNVNVRPLSQVPKNSSYIEQVRRIAPNELHDRCEESDFLHRFCVAVEAQEYAYIKGPAWAGKSALLSNFVLNPPKHTRVVSFFITGRLAGASDRYAFVDALIEQLAVILEVPIPTEYQEGLKEAHMLSMLRAAAARCESHRDRLVLVVDGLDEDRGVSPGGNSIAGLLPWSLPDNLRIIVSGRYNPPLPDDVPSNHPLRKNEAVYELGRSEHAIAKQNELQRDLRNILHGTMLERDVLGFIVAARGGLTAMDLAELTREPIFMVEDLLAASFGRAFISRPSFAMGSGPHVYTLAHEELQEFALAAITDQVGTYIERIKNWASTYRDLKWPNDTPGYLLYGYFRMASETNSIPLMVQLATDLQRQNRIRAMSGGDSLALAEIEIAQGRLLERRPANILSMARLSMYRAILLKSNELISDALPEAWVRIGNLNRAKATVYSIRRPERRVPALVNMANALIDCNQNEIAQECIEAAFAASSNFDDEYERHLIPPLAKVLVRLNKKKEVEILERRLRVFTSNDDEDFKVVMAWIYLIEFYSAVRDAEKYERATLQYLDLVLTLDNPWTQTLLLDQAISISAKLEDGTVLTPVLNRWRQLSAGSDPILRNRALAGLAMYYLSKGDFLESQRYLGEIEDESERFSALVDGYIYWASSPLKDCYNRMLEMVRSEWQGLADPTIESEKLSALCRTLLGAKEFDLAREVIGMISYTGARVDSLAEFAVSLAKSASSLDEAEKFALDSEALSRADGSIFGDIDSLVSIIASIPESGHVELVERLLQICTQVLSNRSPDLIDHWTLYSVTRVLARSNSIAEFERLLEVEMAPQYSCLVLAAMARASAGSDVSNLLDRIDCLLREVVDSVWRMIISRDAMSLSIDIDNMQKAEMYQDFLLESLNSLITQSISTWAEPQLFYSLVSNGQIERAVRIATHPTSSYSRLYLVRALCYEGEFELAETVTAGTIDSERVLAMLCLARYCIEDQDFIKAYCLVADIEAEISTSQSSRTDEFYFELASIYSLIGLGGKAREIASCIHSEGLKFKCLLSISVLSPEESDTLRMQLLDKGGFELSLEMLGQDHPNVAVRLAEEFVALHDMNPIVANESGSE